MMSVPPDHLLTPREHDVMNLVARGESDRRIALLLCIAPQTVTHYAQSAMQKLGAPNRTAAAVRYAAHAWPPTAAALPEKLSAQEGRVLALVAEGFTDQQIAVHLQRGPSTVKQHLLSARRKLGVPNRTAAAVEYYRRGGALSYMKKTGSNEAE